MKSQNSGYFSLICDMLDTETFGAIGISMRGARSIEATGAIDSEIYAGVSLLPASSDSSILVAKKIIVPIQYSGWKQ